MIIRITTDNPKKSWFASGDYWIFIISGKDISKNGKRFNRKKDGLQVEYIGGF
jgi:hypothetical protein